jgi:hypothetical protein
MRFVFQYLRIISSSLGMPLNLQGETAIVQQLVFVGRFFQWPVEHGPSSSDYQHMVTAA